MFVERYIDVTLHFTFPTLFPTKIVRVVSPYLPVILFQFVVAKETCCKVTTSGVPRNFFREGGQQIQLRTEGRENGDLGSLAP
jgi:hypothetical protein